MAAQRSTLILGRRGFAKLLGAITLITVSACSPVPPPATPTPTLSAEDLLALASRRLAETPTVHFALDVTGDTFVDSAGAIRLLGAEGDLQRPDRVHTTFQAEVMGRAVSLQLITIDTRSWTTNILTGEWGEAPLEFAYRPDVLFSTQDGIGPVMGRVEDVTRVPDEQLNGRQTHRLRATVDDSVVGPLTYYTLSGSPVTVELWIDAQSHDLLRAQLSEPPGADRPSPAVWDLELSHHGEEVTIEPPV